MPAFCSHDREGGDGMPNHRPNRAHSRVANPMADAKFANEDQNKRPIQQGTWDFATLQLIRQLHNIRQYMSYKVRNVLSPFAPMMGLHWRFVPLCRKVKL